uniref:Mesothelin-like protein n=1 Tax=Kryptolebias marmoratus TaxID=37003 RepID=A0A3Q3F5Q4_KRYMA
MTLSNNTQMEIYKNIVLLLQGSAPLKCYMGGSFYIFLRNTFLSFGFPDVSTFISLLPPTRKSELLNTISTSELHQFLSQSGVINNTSDVCVIFDSYKNTNAFLENEVVSDDLKKVILPCVWKFALRSNSRSEVNLWFDVRLKNYLGFLTKSLISPAEVQNASCFAFQRLVSFLGNNFMYTSSDFGREDVYATIRSYLSNGSGVRCYNPNDPELNSTSWFVDYIGSFVTFITLDDFTSFASTSQTRVLLVDQANQELFSNAAIPEDVRNYYIIQLYAFDSTYSVINLPGILLCSPDIPSSVFSALNEADTMVILDRRKEFCNGTVDPEVSAALASNIQTFTAQTIENLGSASSGLTSAQITSIPPAVLELTLSILALVTTWNQDQANKIVQALLSAGFQLNNASSLESLGSLVVGLPSKSIEKITASELLTASKNPILVSNMVEAPKVLQETFVKKIISVDSSPAKVVENVPDPLATEIPPILLLFPAGTADISMINKKTWTQDQSVMFFGALAEGEFDTEQLSRFVLQGFTCTTVRKMNKNRIRQLVRACRPRKGRAKVELKEPQLTCMYNLLQGELSQNFTDYPSDMLLYLSTKDVQRSNCRSYFSALGAADFMVASSSLNKGQQQLSEAKTCLGINGLSLSTDNLEVLGSMVCTLDSSYIENSDPLILEKLKACKDFTDSQIAAMERLLLSGNTKYGDVATWNQQTLEDLGNLPLYFTRNIWGPLRATTKKRFLKGFMPNLRKAKTQKKKLKKLFKQVTPLVARRAAGCTVGNITGVTVSDPSFPFGYDLTQFDLCLDVPVLKENLNAICEKVDDDDFQKVILEKLNQAYPSGVSDQDVQVLGSVSRVASLDDISKWNITNVDTLAALMKTEDGTWDPAKSKEIIMKYLSTSGNTLGSTELNVIDSNLCSLDTSTLRTITPDSIKNANLLNVAECSLEQKKVLYEISNTSFSSLRGNPRDFYNLNKGYLGGAPLMDIVKLSTQNISMDVNVFRSLDPNVITSLTVTNVQGLMGQNVPDLKLFENDTLIENWVNLQRQSDLDRLGVGLITTRTDPTTAAPNSNMTETTVGTSGQNNTTDAVTGTQGNTTSLGSTQAGATATQGKHALLTVNVLTFKSEV